VLVLDQFEEVFTLGERLAERVDRFKSDLGDLAENRIPAALASRLAVDPSTAQRLDLRRMAYKLVVTLREDFLPHLEGWRAAVPSLGRVRVRLLPMRPEQALSAVHDTAPDLMDETLARRIVEFVAAAAQGEGTEQEPFGGGEIEPALLSLFCRGLNERRKQQGSDHFDDQLLEGAQQSIIADYYRSCVEGLPDSVSRFIETDLITEKGFRNSYAKDDAVPSFLTEEQLDRLINRRLLRVEERYGTARIELTHDLLTRAVMADRDRRRLEEERQALAVQARRQRRRVLALALVAVVCLVFAGIAVWKFWATPDALARWGLHSDESERVRRRENVLREITEAKTVLPPNRIASLSALGEEDRNTLGEVLLFLSQDSARSDITRFNALALGSELRKGQKEQRWYIKDLIVNRASLENISLANATLLGGSWKDVEIRDSTFSDTYWTKDLAKKNLILSGTTFRNVNFLGGEINEIVAVDVAFINTKFRGVVIDTTNFSKVRFQTPEDHGTEGIPIITPDLTLIERSVVISRREPPAKGVLDLTMTGDDVVFDGVVFRDSRLEGWFRPEWFRHSSFERCILPASLSTASLEQAGNTVTDE